MPGGHDIVLCYWGRSHWIAVKCTCFERGREPLAKGVRLLARDAVAAWRQHLYDEGVIPREPQKVRELSGSSGSRSGGRVLRPAGG